MTTQKTSRMTTLFRQAAENFDYGLERFAHYCVEGLSQYACAFHCIPMPARPELDATPSTAKKDAPRHG